jgi:hypothetical protein
VEVRPLGAGFGLEVGGMMGGGVLGVPVPLGVVEVPVVVGVVEDPLDPVVPVDDVLDAVEELRLLAPPVPVGLGSLGCVKGSRAGPVSFDKMGVLWMLTAGTASGVTGAPG